MISFFFSIFPLFLYQPVVGIVLNEKSFDRIEVKTFVCCFKQYCLRFRRICRFIDTGIFLYFVWAFFQILRCRFLFYRSDYRPEGID